MTLELMICTIYPDGIRRVARMDLPRVDQVSYLISWQKPGDEPIPTSLACRDDIRIIKNDTKGVARNRNIALEEARGDILLLSDDDLSYKPEDLKEIIHTFEKAPELDFAIFKSLGGEEKIYPDEELPISLPFRKKGWYFVEYELALRREKVQGSAWFDERFGIGDGYIQSGEGDTLLVQMVWYLNLRGRFYPKAIVTHPQHNTTGARLNQKDEVIRSRGVFRQLFYPRSWYLRIIVDAIRDKKSGRAGFWRSLKALTEGAIFSIGEVQGGKLGRRLK